MMNGARFFLLVGGVILIGGIIAGGYGMISIEDDPDVLIDEINSDLEDSVVWRGNGEVSENISLKKGYHYTISTAIGVEVYDISIKNTGGNHEELMVFEECGDKTPDDEFDDCSSFAYRSIGKVNGTGPANISINASGEVVIIDDLVAESEIGNTLWRLYLKGFTVGLGGACTTCCGLIVMGVAGFFVMKKGQQNITGLVQPNPINTL